MPLKDCQQLEGAGLTIRANSPLEKRKMNREEELISQGWQKRSTQNDPRLSEIVAAYEEIGLEVRLEPFCPDGEEGCTGCMAASPDNYRTIYTRKKQSR